VHPSSFNLYALIGIGAVLLLLILPLIKWLAWKLFSFDQEVNKLLSQKKSSEVRLGKISETLAPVLEGFPVDPEKPGTSTLFLGQPIDFVHIDPDQGITFIEVKSGNSKLSANQKKIKALIEDGKVKWAEFQVK